MFTGIITHLGTVELVIDQALKVKTPKELWSQLTRGMSIAVDGICLTVTRLENSNLFSIEFMPETARKTTIKYLAEGKLVNLELPATAETFLAGHVVQGHVDTVSRVLAIEKQGNSRLFTFSLKRAMGRYLVDKGSVAVNGISLTVITAAKDYFTVGIIPHTWSQTMLHQLQAGDYVNVEVDVLAKYVEKLMTETRGK